MHIDRSITLEGWIDRDAQTVRAACTFVPRDEDRALLLAENQFQHSFCAPPSMGLRVVLKPPKFKDIDRCAHIPVIYDR